MISAPERLQTTREIAVRGTTDFVSRPWDMDWEHTQLGPKAIAAEAKSFRPRHLIPSHTPDFFIAKEMRQLRQFETVPPVTGAAPDFDLLFRILKDQMTGRELGALPSLPAESHGLPQETSAVTRSVCIEEQPDEIDNSVTADVNFVLSAAHLSNIYSALFIASEQEDPVMPFDPDDYPVI